MITVEIQVIGGGSQFHAVAKAKELERNAK